MLNFPPFKEHHHISQEILEFSNFAPCSVGSQRAEIVVAPNFSNVSSDDASRIWISWFYCVNPKRQLKFKIALLYYITYENMKYFL